MPELPHTPIHTATLKVIAYGDRAILEVSFGLSPVLRWGLGWVLGVAFIWSVEQCWRWVSALMGWLG